MVKLTRNFLIHSSFVGYLLSLMTKVDSNRVLCTTSGLCAESSAIITRCQLTVPEVFFVCLTVVRVVAFLSKYHDGNISIFDHSPSVVLVGNENSPLLA